MDRLSLDPEATQQLLTKYQNEHSLIAEGAALNHGISPIDFNSHVDDALPLEELLAPDPELYKMLQEMDRSKVKLWLLTNAYVNHSKRVIRILGIEDQFEGLTYCDYGVTPMLCKPSFEMFRKAMKEAGVNDVEACYFVGMYVTTGSSAMTLLIVIQTTRLRTVGRRRSLAGLPFI
jgi:pyrimidine and pyridine-specific 5'-nucleotidase